MINHAAGLSASLKNSLDYLGFICVYYREVCRTICFGADGFGKDFGESFKGMKTKKQTLLALVISVIMLTASPVPAEILYNLTDLGAGVAFSINNNGQVVGVNSSSQATLFDTTGQGNNTNLGSNSQATSISDNGQIVGWSDLTPPDPTYTKAIMFRTSPKGYYVDKMGDGKAFSINNSGKMAGYSLPFFGLPKAALFEYTAPPFPGYNITSLGNGQAYSINDNGRIVGYTLNTSGKPYATIFDSTGHGNNTNIGTLNGYNSSEARSINESGRIVGCAYIYDIPSPSPIYFYGEDYRAVLFDESGAGNNTYLGALDGYSDSLAWSINDSGKIVGCSYNPTSQPWEDRATLFTSTGGDNNIDLNDLIDPALGWTLTMASSVNNNGWIVGTMYDSNHDYHAYLLTPVPEPTTLLLLALGGLMLRRKR
jgi:uncharacterized membrane protein